MQIPQFKLIIGLGNSGEEYQNTYHNVGYLFVDYLRKAKPEYAAEKTDGYMNESAVSVKKIMRRRNAALEATLIAHDDSDLFIGDCKLSFDRGSAGHKGVQNIMDTLKSKKFWRLRIGIRPKPTTNNDLEEAGLSAGARRAKAGEFVLKHISAADKKNLAGVFEQAAQLLADTR